jgi:pyruvate/2-oxoglutarate dehydrogenase complex dihydrolipoamide dehydrogenase (E3) component
MPSAIYTDIQVARVGVSVDELSDAHRDSYIVIKLDRDQNDKSTIIQDTNGYMRIIFKRLTGTIVGAEVVGHDTVEILSLLTYLIQHEVSAFKVTSQIFPYPVRSHLIKKICGQFVISTIQNRKNHL